MSYIIKRQIELDFDKVQPAYINNYVWGGIYRPAAFAKLVLIEGKGFALQMTCYEKNPMAVYDKFDDPVWKDSCMEFFASFNNESNLYINLEMNSAGAYLMGLRESRENKRNAADIVNLDAPKVIKTGGYWQLEYFFSFEVLNSLFGEVDYCSGYTFKGNFYKCGDDTDIPHFGMWNPVGTEKPDFHRPEYFGELIIE